MLRDDSSPSYEQLFGDLDFRDDDDARSVYSPAAYFVELLRLLESTFDQPSLLARRPDLTQVLLDAEHTFTESPYLDIVNKVLERLVGDDPYETLRTGWPAPGAVWVRLALGGGPASGPDRLGRPPATATARRAFTDDPQQTEATMVATPGVRSRGRLVFLTPPLARDVRLSGTAQISLRARVDRPTTPLTALLVDYGPDRRIGPDEGIRTLYTKSCWGAATDTDNGCYLETVEITRRTDVAVLTRGLADAAHHRSLLRRDPLRPGVDYPLRWPLLPQDVTVHRGHRLGLVLAATDPDMMLADENSSATVSVLLAGSSVTLPVVGGSTALLPSLAA